MSEHMGVSALTNKTVCNSTHTAIKEHCKTGHIAGFDNFSILARADSTYLLELKESLFILRDNPVLNKTISSAPLYLYN